MNFWCDLTIMMMNKTSKGREFVMRGETSLSWRQGKQLWPFGLLVTHASVMQGEVEEKARTQKTQYFVDLIKHCRLLQTFILGVSLVSQMVKNSFLENPMDRGAWQATVHRVKKSQTQLSTHTSCRAYRAFKRKNVKVDGVNSALMIYYPSFSTIKFISIIYSTFVVKLLLILNYTFPQGFAFKQITWN